MDLDLATREAICQLVAGLITSDAKLDTKEAAFVYRLARNFGIETTAHKPIIPLVDHEAAAARVLALPAPAQTEALRLLVDAACIDGHIATEERAYLRAICSALHISDEDLERLILRRVMG